MDTDAYRQQLRQQEHDRMWARFQQSYPPHIWGQMSQVQQHEAWLRWQGEYAARQRRWTFGRVVGVVAVAFVVLIVLVVVL